MSLVSIDSETEGLKSHVGDFWIFDSNESYSEKL